MLKGFEFNAVSRTTKPRCKEHWFRGEPCFVFVKSLGPRPEFTSRYYCLKCAPTGNQTPKLQSYKGWILMLNVPVSRPQKATALQSRRFLKFHFHQKVTQSFSKFCSAKSSKHFESRIFTNRLSSEPSFLIPTLKGI